MCDHRFGAALLKPLLIVGLLVMAAGCASPFMADLPEDKTNFTPGPDEAMVVFMRPSAFGGAVQSVVYDVTGGTPEFIGIVSASRKIAYSATPGERRFMVVSESADFADAELLAGKTYYMLVTPRFGVWRARFSLRPVSKSDMAAEPFDDWVKGTKWVENTPASHQWARENEPSVREKMAAKLPEWLAKEDRPILRAQDGI